MRWAELGAREEGEDPDDERDAERPRENRNGPTTHPWPNRGGGNLDLVVRCRVRSPRVLIHLISLEATAPIDGAMAPLSSIGRLAPESRAKRQPGLQGWQPRLLLHVPSADRPRGRTCAYGPTGRSKYVVVYQRQPDGSLKIAVDAGSSDGPSAASG
jgi:hypothetical protein